MIYSEKVRKACEVMYEAHQKDVDKGGYPYVFHPMHLAEQMSDEDETCVALLHDVVEDHGDRWSLQGLSEQFGAAVGEALRLLTHDESVGYMDYVKAISKNEIARKVKMADLKHNLDFRRTNGVEAPKASLYREALSFLESISDVE